MSLPTTTTFSWVGSSSQRSVLFMARSFASASGELCCSWLRASAYFMTILPSTHDVVMLISLTKLVFRSLRLMIFGMAERSFLCTCIITGIEKISVIQWLQKGAVA
jgi:hypothetical protein